MAVNRYETVADHGMADRPQHKQIAESALSVGGTRPEHVESMLLKACRISLEDGLDDERLWFEAEIALSPTTREIAIEHPMIVRYERDFDIGAGRIMHSLPVEIVDHLASLPRPPLFVVDVDASDEESARAIAADHFDGAMAIIAAAGRPPGFPIPATVMVFPDGSVSSQS